MPSIIDVTTENLNSTDGRRETQKDRFMEVLFNIQLLQRLADLNTSASADCLMFIRAVVASNMPAERGSMCLCTPRLNSLPTCTTAAPHPEVERVQHRQYVRSPRRLST